MVCVYFKYQLKKKRKKKHTNSIEASYSMLGHDNLHVISMIHANIVELLTEFPKGMKIVMASITLIGLN